MRTRQSVILFLFFAAITLFSCKENNRSTQLLKQAQTALENNPSQSLIFLDSIDDPKSMDEYNYMQYIVVYVGAKQETKADISADSLILKARNYFNAKADHKNSALANYYAGWVFYVNKLLPQSLESFMNAAYYGQKADNNLVTGMSYNNIGYIYFEQDLFDSAAVNYKRALLNYDKVENIDKKKIKVFINIGRTYEADNRLDSALLYFHRGLDLSKQTGSKVEESQFYINLGVTYYGQKEYEKAIGYFHSALNMDIINQRQIQKIHLYLLNIYNKKNDLKSAKQYADLVITELPEVTYIYTIKIMYAALADYYMQSGDYKQAIEYRDLEKITKEQIEKEANAPALFEADKIFHVELKDREVQALRSDVIFFLLIGTIIFGIILAFIVFLWWDHKKGKAEMRAYTEKYEILTGMLHSNSDHYSRVEAKLKSMSEGETNQ